MELVRIADAVRGDTNKHMAHEEQEVLPLLEAHLCAAEQRAMVWRTLRAMPLRLLERVMPWVAGTASIQLKHLCNVELRSYSPQVSLSPSFYCGINGFEFEIRQFGDCKELSVRHRGSSLCCIRPALTTQKDYALLAHTHPK